jgi:hypothetical protein
MHDLRKSKYLQAAGDGGSRYALVDVERPELTADGLPEDPAQEDDDKEEPPDDEVPTEPGADADKVTDEKNDADMETETAKGDNQEEKDEKEEKKEAEEEKEENKNGAKAAKEFEMTEEMKGRLLRFTLVEGELEDIPTGRSMRDSLPEDMGVVYVDQVCVVCLLCVVLLCMDGSLCSYAVS